MSAQLVAKLLLLHTCVQVGAEATLCRYFSSISEPTPTANSFTPAFFSKSASRRLKLVAFC